MTQTTLHVWTQSSDGELKSNLLPLFSSRGCTQTLTLIGAPLLRTLQDSFVQLSEEKPRYTSRISCTDTYPPALETLKSGSLLWVDALVHLTQSVTPGSTKVKLTRIPVPGSLMLEVPEAQLPLADPSDRTLTLDPAPTTGPCFISYRPRLHMALKTFSLEADEATLTEKWHLELEEVPA